MLLLLYVYIIDHLLVVEPRLDSLLPFGIDFGDATVRQPSDDGDSGPIDFDCRFYGASEDTLYVSGYLIITPCRACTKAGTVVVLCVIHCVTF